MRALLALLAPLLLALLAGLLSSSPSSALSLQDVPRAIVHRLSALGDAASARLHSAARGVYSRALTGTVPRAAGHHGAGQAEASSYAMEALTAGLGFRELMSAASTASRTAAAGMCCTDAEPMAVEASMSADQLIQHWGYPGERHRIPTEDGYLLTMQRVPWGRGQQPQAQGQPRPVVLLQHGLLQSSDQWLLRGPGLDLALLLADQGYDVWLGNFRGNNYCKRHVSMSPKDDERFWDFSWHENGCYDLAAMIDYVLAVTEQPALSFVGHSMGTTAILALLAWRPEYNKHIRCASLLAPVVYFSRARGFAALAFPITRKIERDIRGVHMELFPKGTLPHGTVYELCRAGAPTAALCIAFYSQAAGPDPRQLNTTLFPTCLSHVPAGASLGQFVHYAQVQKSGCFRRYDHGVRGNTLRYGQAQPPAYNLSRVTAAMFFYYSTGDYLSGAKDVERLISEVPGTAGVYKVPHKDFNHGDYMWALDTYDLLYRAVLKNMRNYI